MGLREWINRLRGREDASELRHEEELRTETPSERAASSGGIEGMAADEASREHGGEPPVAEPDLEPPSDS
jgi:hypothetical protein